MPLEILRIGHATHGNNGTEHYRFEDIWSMHLYGYGFAMDIGKERLAIEAGDVTLVPPQTQMSFHYQQQAYRHYYTLFRASEIDMPQRSHFRLDHDALHCCRQIFRSAVQYQHIQERCVSAVQELLWQLQLLDNADNNDLVTKAQHIVAAELSTDLSVNHIARDLNISGNQLTRLFRKKLNMTVIAYIRHERMRLAKRLLQKTDLPVKRVAEECGYNDLQYFNKTIRQFFDVSPRQLRSLSTD